jgi:hypothetical protein
MYRLRRKHRKHMDKKLLFRLRIYFVISIVLLGIVLFEVLSGRVSYLLAIIGLIIGVTIGVVAARMFLLSWHYDAKKVISQLDTIGGVLLALYIVFAIFRSKIIGQFVPASYVTGTSLSVAGGIMIGRVFGTGQKIVAILKEQDLFGD